MSAVTRRTFCWPQCQMPGSGQELLPGSASGCSVAARSRPQTAEARHHTTVPKPGQRIFQQCGFHAPTPHTPGVEALLLRGPPGAAGDQADPRPQGWARCPHTDAQGRLGHPFPQAISSPLQNLLKFKHPPTVSTSQRMKRLRWCQLHRPQDCRSVLPFRHVTAPRWADHQ